MDSDIENRLLADINWRENELAALKAAYKLEPRETYKGKGLRRSYLAMLYAHYEGFSKVAWEEVQIEIANSRRPYTQIKSSLLPIFLDEDCKRLRNLPTAELFDGIFAIRSRLLDRVDGQYKKIETSNLWPNVLIEILSALHLRYDFVERNRVHLKSLVARRNEIAHGQDVEVSDRDLEQLLSAVLDTLLCLIIEIVDYVQRGRFLVGSTSAV